LYQALLFRHKLAKMPLVPIFILIHYLMW